MKSTDAQKQPHTSNSRSNQPFFGTKSQAFFSKGEASLSQTEPFFNPSGAAATPIQAKLTVGAVGDKYEQEAERVASEVVDRINAPSPQPSDESQSVQRMGEEEDELQMKPMVQRVGAEGGSVSADLEGEINRARGGGQSLAPQLQAQMGQAMGADFSGVRVHTDGRSDQLNQSIRAKAFTTGQDVFFRQGAYEPGSRGGQGLIAHELTHVMQQRGRAVQQSPTILPNLPHLESPNKTGLPDDLKAGVESLGNQQQKKNSSPVHMITHADKHVAPGQEQYLPNETWHVVQQAQSATISSPTMQTSGTIQRELEIEKTKYTTFKKFEESDHYQSVLDWLIGQDREVGKKGTKAGYDTTLKQYVSSQDVEAFYSLDHFKQNMLYDLRQGTWTKDSNASATLRYMTRRGWKNAAANKDTIDDTHAQQSISLYRTMFLEEAIAIMIDRDISKLKGHMGDYAAALNYCHRATDDRVLVEFKLKPGQHKALFSTEKTAIVSGGTTTEHIRTRHATPSSSFAEATSGEGLHRDKVGVKSEEHGVAGFSLAAHGNVASNVLKPMIESIRPLLLGKKGEAPKPITKKEFVRTYS